LNNSDVSKLLGMLSKMDKNDLQNGLAQANKILSQSDKAKLQEMLKNINK